MARRVPPQMFVRHNLTPERKLWRAVLAQAWADANANTSSSQDGEGKVTPATRAIARRFLRAASAGEANLLALVCELADVPYDRVVLWARQRLPLELADDERLEEIIAEEATADEIIATEIIIAAPSDALPN